LGSGLSSQEVENIFLHDSPILSSAWDAADIHSLALRNVSNSWSCQSFVITWGCSLFLVDATYSLLLAYRMPLSFIALTITA
jgi:hypothetical protein